MCYRSNNGQQYEPEVRRAGCGDLLLGVEVVQAEVGAGDTLVAQDTAKAVIMVAFGGLGNCSSCKGDDGEEAGREMHVLSVRRQSLSTTNDQLECMSEHAADASMCKLL